MQSVTVLIPAYNSAAHIRKSIESVLNQTILPLEVIVINDGSTDETETIAKSYGGIVRVISKGRNCGLPAARNFGIDSALGDWIAFLDSDDEWEPTKNEASITIADLDKSDWCMVAQSIVSGSDCKICSKTFDGTVDFDSYFSLVRQGRGCSPSSFMVRKRLFEKVGKFNEVLTTGEDLEMWWRIAIQEPIIGYCSLPLVRYYVNVPGSMTSSPRNESKLIAFWKSVTQIAAPIEDADNSKLFEQVRNDFATKAVRFYIREGYYEAATHLKNEKTISYHPLMRILLTLPYFVSKFVFVIGFSLKNDYYLNRLNK